MCFMIFYNENASFQAIKTRNLNSPRNDIFSKWLVHDLAQKLAIFPTFFISNIKARKMCFMIFYNKNTSFQAIKTRNSKSRKNHLFSKWLVHDLGPKLAIFQLFLRQYRGQQNMFYILEQKNAFLCYKIEKFQK